MSEHKLLTGSEAVALAVLEAGPRVISAYPITPQTGIIEKLSEYKAEGKLPSCQFVTVESEHSAMALLIGAGQAGVRAFTATSSHGLLYMHEVLHWVAGARLPVVLVNANRAIGAPWNIACDRTDSLSQRDTGWIQLYCENNQEVYDSVLMAFHIAETSQFPVMVNMDGFLLSHTKQPVTVVSPEDAKRFIGTHKLPHAIDPFVPRSYGASGTSDYYFRLKENFAGDMRDVLRTFARSGRRFQKLTGRPALPVETYRMEDAETAMVIMGSTASIVKGAVDEMRENGLSVGVVKIRQFRPFPAEALRKALCRARKVIVCDVNQYEIVLSETRSALYGKRIPIHGFTVGVGGVPMSAKVFRDIVEESSGSDVRTPLVSAWRGVPKLPHKEVGVPIVSAPSSSEFVNAGHRACAGCTASLVMRHVLDAVGKNAQVALPACCWSIIAGPNPYTPLNVNMVHCPFETAAATASGLARAGKELGNDAVAIAFAGDGGTLDIGLQALSGAAERGEDIIYICYDNEAYMNTGGQRSSGTPMGAITETTPSPAVKSEPKKNILKIMAAHGIPYVATASVYHLADLRAKLAKAVAYKGRGLRFIQILAPCNPGWKIDPASSLRMAHLAVETNAFPLVECEMGKWRITYRPKEKIPVREYILPQGRFAHFSPEDILRAQASADSYVEELEKLEKYF